jgi:LacI family transcriptional regulator
VAAATTKDLAAAAGVSLATVDRVLNNRPNVSEKTKAKVKDAIEKTGFVRNLAAVNLLRNRPYRFRFILPANGDEYLSELLHEVEHTGKVLKNDMTEVEAVQLDMADPIAVANYLSALETSDLEGVAVMAPESPPVRDAIARLHERGLHVVQFLSGQEKLDDIDFVGIDNLAAGSTAAKIVGKFCGGKKGSIMVVAETMQAMDSIERRLGFDRTIAKSFAGLRPLPSLETYGNAPRAEKIIANQLQHNADIIAVYVLSSEARLPIKVLQKMSNLKELVVVAHERTPFSEAALVSDEVDAIIAQNPGHAVRSALRILRARSEAREPIAAQENIRIEILLSENL